MKNKSVALNARQVMGVYTSAKQFKKGTDKAPADIPVPDRKSIRRIIRAVEGHEDFDKKRGVISGWCPYCEAKSEIEEGDANPTCACGRPLNFLPEMWIEIKGKERDWIWDQIKVDIAKTTEAEIEEIELMAKALGKMESFTSLTEEWDEDDDEEENKITPV